VPREIPRPDKVAKVQWLAELLKESTVTVLADYTGLNVEAMTVLRAACRESNVELRVLKNTLGRLASEQIGLSELTEFQDGPTAYAFSDDVVAPAKTLREFAKTYPQLRLKGGVLEGNVISADQVTSLATLPSREVLLSQMLAGLQGPISGLVNVLNGNIRGLAQVLAAIRDQKEAA